MWHFIAEQSQSRGQRSDDIIVQQGNIIFY